MKSIKKISSSHGNGLAAPQIGYNLRIFIILKDVLKISEKTNHPARTAAFKEFQETAGRNEPQFFIFINPKIIKKSKKKQILEEGCLSVEGIFGKIKRPEKITVEAFDENGKKFQMSGAKIMAEAIEHETDHLDGILFIDKIMKNL